METNILAVIVGRNILRHRLKHDVNQAELANRLGITQDAMSRMEKGKIAPKMSRLPEIANALGCTVSSLFREQSTDTEERAAAIAEILGGLPAEAQDALVELVAVAANIMKNK